jgi:hypothetical protein
VCNGSTSHSCGEDMASLSRPFGDGGPVVVEGGQVVAPLLRGGFTVPTTVGGRPQRALW